MKIIYLALGGAGGTVLRYTISEITNRLFTGQYPLGTFIVNMIGSFLIGLAFGLTDGTKISPNMKLFLFAGFFGGFTTFSSFSHENASMLQSGQHHYAFLYIISSNLAGITLAWLGYLLAGYLKTDRL